MAWPGVILTLLARYGSLQAGDKRTFEQKLDNTIQLLSLMMSWIGPRSHALEVLMLLDVVNDIMKRASGEAAPFTRLETAQRLFQDKFTEWSDPIEFTFGQKKPLAALISLCPRPDEIVEDINSTGHFLSFWLGDSEDMKEFLLWLKDVELLLILNRNRLDRQRQRDT